MKGATQEGASIAKSVLWWYCIAGQRSLTFFMDRIIIRDLRANSLVGTLEREQKYRQEIAATLTLELDLAPAGRSDDLTKSVDYSEIARRAKEIMETKHFQLLEALGNALGEMLMEYPAVVRASVRLEKPRALDCAHVAIEMEFDRKGARKDG